MSSVKRAFVVLTPLSLIFLTACGGGNTPPAPPAPVFTTTPSLMASEGEVYAYAAKATDPAGGTVALTLSQSPAGATFAMDTVGWTPSSTEARVENSFTITATSSEGGRASQTWNVVPSGTIRGSWIDTYWTSRGRVDSPVDWTKFGLTPLALIPQPDGSVVTLSAMVNPDGTFSIAKVPGGFYWFQFANNSFWTSSSSIDYGADISGRRLSTTPTSQTTTFHFDVSGLDPVQTPDQFAFLTELANPFNIGFPIPSPTGSTTMNASWTSNTNLDYTTALAGFLLQYEPASAGSISGVSLGPELTISNLSLTNGSDNTLTGHLLPSPASSFPLSVKGSEWALTFQNVAPGTATPANSSTTVYAQPFAERGVLASTLRFDVNLPLFMPGIQGTGGGFLLSWPGAGGCVDDVQFVALQVSSHPAIVTDEDFGALTYGDPFPAEWTRVFSFCQTATFDMPIPNSSDTTPVLFGAGENTAIPSEAVAPLILPVQNPMINGASLFTATSLNPSGITLSWSPPTGMQPTFYKVAAFILRTQSDGSRNYFSAGTFSTAKTAMTLPPLQSGQTYVFAVSAKVDGRANVEASPNRSSLPTAYATLVSAPITTN